MKKKDRIIALLSVGRTYKEIRDELGCSKSTISFHASRMGLGQDDGGASKRYDWAAVQAYHDAGHSPRACADHFGFTRAAWHKAVASGRIVPSEHSRYRKDPIYLIPLSDLLVRGRLTNRGNLKKRLVDNGLLRNECYRCGIAEWMGERLPLELHHKDGDGANNLLENLEILCPNCHSITPTWGGRNAKRHSGVV